MSSSGFRNDYNDYECKPQTCVLHFRKTTEVLRDVEVLFVLSIYELNTWNLVDFNR